MSIIPPFDEITKLPAIGVNLIQQEFNKIIDQTLDSTKEVITDSVKLPKGIKCDDPRITKIKADLTSVQDGITKIKDTIPKIQKAVDSVKTAITIAQGIINTINAAQLSNPVTAPVFIANQAIAIQNQLIVNGVAAIQPLSNIPTQTLSKLETLVPPLVAAIARLNSVCPADDELTVPILTDESDDNLDDIFGIDDFNDQISSEFYRDVNVSESDLQQRSDAIQELISQQENLLSSLQEAPSQVYKDNGPPASNLGKLGDFYVDIQNNIPYGPKKSDTDWGGPIYGPNN